MTKSHIGSHFFHPAEHQMAQAGHDIPVRKAPRAIDLHLVELTVGPVISRFELSADMRAGRNTVWRVS